VTSDLGGKSSRCKSSAEAHVKEEKQEDAVMAQSIHRVASAT